MHFMPFKCSVNWGWAVGASQIEEGAWPPCPPPLRAATAYRQCRGRIVVCGYVLLNNFRFSKTTKTTKTTVDLTDGLWVNFWRMAQTRIMKFYKLSEDK